jgi:hypothetical protein
MGPIESLSLLNMIGDKHALPDANANSQKHAR